MHRWPRKMQRIYMQQDTPAVIRDIFADQSKHMSKRGAKCNKIHRMIVDVPRFL